MKLGGVLFKGLFVTLVSLTVLSLVGMLFADRLELSFLNGLEAYISLIAYGFCVLLIIIMQIKHKIHEKSNFLHIILNS